MTLLDADFASIEARITVWLAGQEDALDEYRQGIDRYVAMASVIYRVDAEKVNKHPQRFVGKQATLGCGFGMGPPKFRATCWKMGRYELPLGLEEVAVKAWRLKHKKVVSYWYDVERAAKNAILHKGKVFEVRKHIKFMVRDVEGMEFLLLRLPSGRKLAYPKPRLCGDRIAFFGNIKGAVWGDISTWGGSLVENCLDGDTEVLSQRRGWVQMRSVTTDDRLWDGEDFVPHDGLIDKGIQPVLEFHGLRATLDHKFLTSEKLWVSVQTACTYPHIKLYSPHAPKTLSPEAVAAVEHCRQQVWKFYGPENAAHHRKENRLALPMRLWKRGGESGVRTATKKTPAVRLWNGMPLHQRSSIKAQNAWDEQASSALLLGSHESALFQSEAQGMAQLRRTRDICLWRMGRFLRAVLGGYGLNLSEGAGHRPRRQQRELHTKKLPVGDSSKEHAQSSGHYSPTGVPSRLLGRSIGKGNQAQHALLPYQSGTELGADHQHTTGFSEQVYDIRNCGPRHRFAVRGRTGHILIAHNCVQAVAADIMANGSHKAEKAGYAIATLIHDQALAFHAEGQTVERFVELLTDLPSWADGLPIEAEGGVVPFYKKD